MAPARTREKIEMMAGTVFLVSTVTSDQSNAMFSVSTTWINATPQVEVCPILSDSQRPRGVVSLPSNRSSLIRKNAQKSVFVTMPGRPSAPQMQAPQQSQSQSQSPPQSPPQSDDEDDSWLYEC